MDSIRYMIRLFIAILSTLYCWNTIALADNQISVPILTYHRLAPSVTDSMTITTTAFESQLKWLKDNQYTVIPLKTLVNYLQGEGPPPPSKSVVITADDGHKSVYTQMLPLVRQYNIPVTLFIYPSAISNAQYALTWEQLKELQQTGLFDIQGHTFWHPNFNHEKKKLSPVDYQKFVETQLSKSKTVLEKKSDTQVTLLAWPFGIYNDELEKAAEKAGYVMAFSIDARHAKKSENPMAEPRYMIVSSDSMKEFTSIVAGNAQGRKTSE